MSRYNHSSVKTASYILMNISISACLVLSISSCGGGGGNGNTGNSKNSVTLRWEAPTTNADGTPLNDLAGYKVYYGSESRNFTKVTDVGNRMTYKFYSLSPGMYYFSVSAYDAYGNESDYSNEVSKKIE